MLLTCYSEHTASDHTYRDLMAVVNARIIRMCDPEIFDPDEYPWQACGYRFMFSSVQGDLKWLNENHAMHPWRQNRFCTWCHVVKSGSADPSMTAGDFRPTAAHLRTNVSTQEYLRLTPAHERNLSLWHVNKTKSLDRCIFTILIMEMKPLVWRINHLFGSISKARHALPYRAAIYTDSYTTLVTLNCWVQIGPCMEAWPTCGKLA